MPASKTTFLSWALKQNWAKAALKIIELFESTLGARLRDRDKQIWLTKEALTSANFSGNKRLTLGGGLFAGFGYEERKKAFDAEIFQNLQATEARVVEALNGLSNENYQERLVKIRAHLGSFPEQESKFRFRTLEQENGIRHFLGVEPEWVIENMEFTYEENIETNNQDWERRQHEKHEHFANQFPFAGLQNRVLWATMLWHHPLMYTYTSAHSILEMGYLIGIQSLPKDFQPEKHKIPYDYLENRPFYRICYWYAKSLFERGGFIESLKIWNWLGIVFFPDDDGFERHYIEKYKSSLGARKLDFLFFAKPDNDVEQPGIDRAIYLYGQVLAHFLIEDYSSAKEWLRQAKKEYLNIYRILVAVRKPLFFHFEGMGIWGIEEMPKEGSEEQAVLFWKETKVLWQGVSGFTDFMKEPARLSSL